MTSFKANNPTASVNAKPKIAYLNNSAFTAEISRYSSN